MQEKRNRKKRKDTIARLTGWYWSHDFLKAHYFDYGKSACGGEILLTRLTNSQYVIDEKSWKKINEKHQLCKYCINKISEIMKTIRKDNEDKKK